jgi:hypothetical protein
VSPHSTFRAPHGVDLLPSSITGPVNRLSRGDPVLMLLGALALGVLVFSSLTLLRLLARVRGDGMEVHRT